MSITTYKDAADHLGKKTDRPLPGRHTRLIREGDAIAVRYHTTNVITYYPDETVVLKTGGYQTATTKARINEYAPVQVYADRGLWYVRPQGTYDRTQRAVFVDGMSIRPDGTFTAGDTRSAEIMRRTLDRKVRAFVVGYCAHVKTLGTLPEPGNGDCWACLMRPAVERTPYMGVTLAPDPIKSEGLGFDHYISHFDESYFVPSILWNAMRAQGYGPAWPSIMAAEIARGDTRSVRRCLSGFFRKIKPNLLKAMGQ